MIQASPKIRLLLTCAALPLALGVACGDDDASSKGSGGAGGAGGSVSGGGGAGAGGGGASGGSGATGGSAGASGGSAGAGGASGGSAGSDGGTTDASDAGDAGGMGVYVDCVNGSDTTGNGTLSTPFKTIEKAAGVAAKGDVVTILDGKCDETTEPKFNQANGTVDFPDGVGVKAQNAGKVTLQGGTPFRSAGFKFVGSGSVTGLSFVRFGRAISASSGTLGVHETSFDDVYQGRPLELSGSVVATLTPGALTNYIGTNQHGIALLQGSAKLTVTGGAVSGALDSGISGDSLFAVRDASELVLTGVTLADNKLSGIAARNTAKVRVTSSSTIKNTASVACCGQSSIRLQDTALLEVTDSKIEAAPAPAILIDDVSATGSAKQTVSLSNSSITGSTHGILSLATSGALPTVSLDGVAIANNGTGISLQSGGVLVIKASTINDNKTPCGPGIYLGKASAVSSLELRSTQVKNNCTAGIQFLGAAGSSIDLGRGNSLGQNTITGNGTSGVGGLTVETAAAIVAYAAGNTWNPSVQAASASGTYAVPTGQNKLDVTGAQIGQNYAIKGSAAASIVVRLAENACIPQATCN